MIGSRTKRRQFDERLAAFGIEPAAIARMVCPIGIEGIGDKAPEVIALSAAAQLLQAIEAARAAPNGRARSTVFLAATADRP
jgi:xanthine dehydrogenase accessory factor